MSTLVVIGHSQEALDAIEQARKSGHDGEIILLCPAGILPYHVEMLPSWLAKDVKESQVFIHLDPFVKTNHIKLMAHEGITRISSKRKQITMENKSHIPFDRLVITDLADVVYPSFKGIHKEGVYNPFTFSSVKALVKASRDVEHVVAQVKHLAGFNLACAMARLGKDVLILVPKQGVLSRIFDEETSMIIKQVLEAKGIRLMTDDVDEILGDAEVKAVRLESGKVMAAEAVILDDVKPDTRLLQEVEDVAVLGSAKDGFDMPSSLLLSFGVKILDGFFGGQVRLLENGREHMKFDGPSNIYKKIYLLDDSLIGAVWINAPHDRERIMQALATRQHLAIGDEDQFL